MKQFVEGRLADEIEATVETMDEYIHKYRSMNKKQFKTPSKLDKTRISQQESPRSNHSSPTAENLDRINKNIKDKLVFSNKKTRQQARKPFETQQDQPQERAIQLPKVTNLHF